MTEKKAVKIVTNPSIGNKTGVIPTGTTLWKKVLVSPSHLKPVIGAPSATVELISLAPGIVPREFRVPANLSFRKCRESVEYRWHM